LVQSVHARQAGSGDAPRHGRSSRAGAGGGAAGDARAGRQDLREDQRTVVRAVKPITDPALLAQLEQTSPEPAAPRPVTDPALLAELERPMPQMTAAADPTLLGELGQAVATLFGAGGDDRPVLARLDDAAARTRDALIPDALQRG